MNGIEWTLVIAGAGLGTYALRVTPFLSHRLYRVGQNNLRFLTYVSLAIAAGIVARSIMFSGESIDQASTLIVKSAAVMVALALQRFTKNLLVSLFGAVGAAILWQWLTI
jgi:branched-subunit amino acid transport protein